MNAHPRRSRGTILVFVAVVGLTGGVLAQTGKTPAAPPLKNPVPRTPDSLSAGKRAFDTNCAACHGNRAQGAVKAGVVDLDHRGARW